MKRVLTGLILFTLIFVVACTNSNTAMKEEPTDKNSLQLLAGDSSKYYRFNKAHYESSLEEGKVIFLDFHANWCPICKREQPKIFAAFNDLNNPNVVGYEVHFNDGETTKDDKEMAKKYGITNQYTKVIINKNGEVVLKTLEVLDKDRITNEIKKVVGSQ